MVSRTASLIAILLATAGLAGLLALEAWQSEASHRETSERTLRDYASFAAWEFSVGAKEMLYNTLMWVFEPLAHQKPLPEGKPLPPPSVLASSMHDKLKCAGDSAGFLFRLDLRDGSFVTAEGAPPAQMAAWIRDTVPRHARAEYTRDWSYGAIFGRVAGEPRALVYQIKWNAAGDPVAAYGFPLCLSRLGAPLFAKLVEHYPLLPPTLIGMTPNDSVLSVMVTDRDGRPLWHSEVTYASPYDGQYKLGSFGDLVATVTLREDAADELVIGGLPTSRLPVLLSVLAITLVLTGLGVTQLRQESALARMRGDFVAGVSHELRTPLAQVRMFAETLLLGRVRSDEERHRSLQIIDQEARRLTHLVENILQFSRAERRQVRLTLARVDVSAQAREVVESFAPLAAARQAEVALARTSGVAATADVGAFRQILLNLLDNAVKYGPVGQTVRVTVSRAGAMARVTVDDEGPGIPEKQRRRVWEAFFRMERDVGSATAGSGIGLSVVMELALLQGGRAWVEDAPGGGARFVVELPVATGQLTMDEEQPARPAEVSA